MQRLKVNERNEAVLVGTKVRLSAAAAPSSTAANMQFEAFSAVKQAGCWRGRAMSGGGTRPSSPFISFQKGRCNATAQLLFFSFLSFAEYVTQSPRDVLEKLGKCVMAVFAA